MQNSPSSIVESRKELVISPNAQPIFRTAHFVNPSLIANHKPNPDLYFISLPSLPPTSDPQNWPISVQFPGWKNPLEGWKEWVDKMAASHASTWKKAGVYDAIFNSTYKFVRNRDLIVGAAEKWCPETNTFIFPWGEASITLEDMFVAGFSVLGLPVYEPIESEQSKATQQKLALARLECYKTPSKNPGHLLWMRKFMDSGSEIEHEAFLSLWLSRFVLPNSNSVVCEFIFPIAIHLAGGTKIALAPTVLATIYRDLTVLKHNIVALTEFSSKRNTDEKLEITILSPFQLVLMWVLERFVKLQPKPNRIKYGEPRFAQWSNFRCNSKNVRSILDSSRGSFCWRPYCKPLENWDMPKFYKEKEMWVSVNSDLDEELLSFIQCLRVSDLVGLDCIVQYLPHRVARQFGFDQDLPGCVVGSKADPDDAWNSYIRPVGDFMCYIPSHVRETGVTRRYLDWWNSLVFDDQVKPSESEGVGKKMSHKFSNLHQMITQNLRKRKAAHVFNKFKVSAASSKKERKYMTYSSSGETPETFAKSSKVKIEDREEINNLAVPPGFPPKCDRARAADSTDEEDSLTIAKILKSKEKQDVLSIRQCSSGKKFAFNVETTNSSSENHEEDNLTIAEILKHREIREVISTQQCGSCKNFSGTPECHSSPIATKTPVIEAPGKNALKADDDSKSRSYSCSAPHNIKDGDNPVELGQSQSHSSSVAGSESPKDTELQESTIAEKDTRKESAGVEQDVESGNGCVRRSLVDDEMDNGECKYSLLERLEKLEGRVGRVGDKIAARKALLNISGRSPARA